MEALIIDLVEELITQSPALIADFQKLFASGSPTPADFAALRTKVDAEKFEVPDAPES